MDLVEVEDLPIHPYCTMTPVKGGRVGDCCGFKLEAISDGYYCASCDFFAHKRCSHPPPKFVHPYHPRGHFFLKLDGSSTRCDLCGEGILYVPRYKSWTLDLEIHLYCAKHPPPKVIEVPQSHGHKLMLEMVQSCFTCATCGKEGDGYPYKCHECDLTFHVNCEKYEAEVNHHSHSLHPLKLFKNEPPPAYTDGKCRLCGNMLGDEIFYHCSKCNFSLDYSCVVKPPPLYHHDPNTHDHKLTLMPKSISFICTICGLKGDRSPYVCLPCDFIAHNDCSGLPWVINVNRHLHRVSRTSLIGVVNSVCGICQKKMDWSCGGYYCKKCPNYVYHTKCATREDVWDGREMKDEPEQDEPTKQFEVIDENTIRYFRHEKHYLRLHKSVDSIEERNCYACVYPIYHQSLYSCMSCNFVLHESCANLLSYTRHMVSNDWYVLSKHPDCPFLCQACGIGSNGLRYGWMPPSLDVRCASVSEPFFHQSHPDHPLFYTSPQGVCSACNEETIHVLRCVEEDCVYVLDFKCALLPYEVKHRVDEHFLSLCFGEDDERAKSKYWCDICEKETDPKGWFYTCKECGGTLHTNCVLGDFRAFEPGKDVTPLFFNRQKLFVVRNNSMSRPLCNQCKCRCVFTVIMKVVEKGLADRYYCSINCLEIKYVGPPRYDIKFFEK